MRCLWVDEGLDADFLKAKREQMTALFLPISDPIVDLTRRANEIRANNYAAGAYMAANWPMFFGMDGKTTAEYMHSRVAQIGGKLKVQFDIERHDGQYILDVLTRWRALNPTVDTSWTMEGHQGQWMTSDFVKAIVIAKIRVVPQAYGSDMTPWCPLEMARDLTKRGFPDALVSPFHDAARLPKWWTGFAFTQARLP